jgi:hypothetical protein
MSRQRVAILVLACGALGCGSGSASSGLANLPTVADATENKCVPAKSDDKPLVVALASADKLAMESRLRSGPLVVAYGDCKLALLERCSIGGGYRYSGGTLKRDTVGAKNEDELFARIPVGAFGIAGKLKTHGRVAVAMAMVGRFESDATSPSPAGDCQGATHWVSGISVGAYRMAAGADAEVGAEASLFAAAAGARSSSSREALSEDGDGKACEAASDADAKPPRGCGALLRFELRPLGGRPR